METETNQNPGELNGSQVQSQDSDSKLKELKKKAENGDTRYQILYGIELEEAGETEEALAWYKKASDNGDWLGTLRLGKFFENKDNNKSHEYYLKMGEQRDDGVFGIQAFDNPIDAWDTISGSYGDDEGIEIMNDNTFKTAIFGRAIECFWYDYFGSCSKSKIPQFPCDDKFRICLLIYFNFFLYSERSGRFYTSKLDMCFPTINIMSTRQWGILEELMNVYNFNKIVKDAEKLFNKFKYKLVNYHEDDLATFIEDMIEPYIEKY